jgi:hypothetical protein
MDWRCGILPAFADSGCPVGSELCHATRDDETDASDTRLAVTVFMFLFIRMTKRMKMIRGMTPLMMLFRNGFKTADGMEKRWGNF